MSYKISIFTPNHLPRYYDAWDLNHGRLTALRNAKNHTDLYVIQDPGFGVLEFGHIKDLLLVSETIVEKR